MKYLKNIMIIIVMNVLVFNSIVYADLAEEQSKAVAMFAKTFIEKGNSRIDENGYPLMTYAQTDNWS